MAMSEMTQTTVPSYSRFHAIISATPSAAGLAALPPRPTYPPPHLSLPPEPGPPQKRRRIQPSADSFDKTLRGPTRNETAASRQRPHKYPSKDHLLEALKAAFKCSPHVDFHGSFDECLNDPVFNVPHKSRVQTLTIDIWRATGYRFTVKDHPRISNGHKTRFWCSQDEAHRSKSSKLARLPNSTSKPRISSAGEALAKTRYSCKSRLLISSRDTASPTVAVAAAASASAPTIGTATASSTATATAGKNMIRVITVRMHHHVAHEPYVDTSLPPELAQAVYESFGWSSVAGVPIAPLPSSTSTASASASSGAGGLISSAAAAAAAYVNGPGVLPDVLGFGRTDDDVDGEGEGDVIDAEGEDGEMDGDAEVEGDILDVPQQATLNSSQQQQQQGGESIQVPMSSMTMNVPPGGVGGYIDAQGTVVPTTVSTAAAAASASSGDLLYPNASTSSAAVAAAAVAAMGYPQQQQHTPSTTTAPTSAASAATATTAVATSVAAASVGHTGIPTPPLSTSSISSSHPHHQQSHPHTHPPYPYTHPSHIHAQVQTQTPGHNANTNTTHPYSSYPLTNPHPYFHPSPIPPSSHRRVPASSIQPPPPPTTTTPTSTSATSNATGPTSSPTGGGAQGLGGNPLEHPNPYHQRMLHHIHNIREFCSGLEYQLQFEDYRMLDVLEREGEGFLRLVRECLKSEGRLVS